MDLPDSSVPGGYAVRVFLVAIAELGGSLDRLAQVASDLETTVYELKLTLSAGFPAVVLATVDEARATSAVDAIRRQGLRALTFDRATMVPSSAMTSLRDFQFEADALLASAAQGERLPYEDILALLRATHRTTSTSTEEVKERKLRPVMAIATGGLIMSKKTTREVITKTEAREQVLYLFRKSGEAPWILRERAARYMGLGTDLRPTSLENFATTTRRLRELAPLAFYDERLLSGRPIRGVAEGIAATDILAYLLAAHFESADFHGAQR
jgi:hypothetical protein